MKLLAARVERDQDDIRVLYELCGFTTAEEGLDLVASTYPAYVIPAGTRFMLKEMYPSKQLGIEHDPGLDLGR
jgi:hypothetical protein